jgi:hypothetical protein
MSRLWSCSAAREISLTLSHEGLEESAVLALLAERGFYMRSPLANDSRRSTCPGFIGRLGAARSSAWIPVISSIEAVCTPCWAAVEADRYTAQMSVHLVSKSGSGLGEPARDARGQPVAVEMRLEIGLFLKKRPTEPCEMLLTMPRMPRATDRRASSI